MVSEKELEDIVAKLRNFIDLALQGDERDLDDFLSSYSFDSSIKCWESKFCDRQDCPAFENKTGRCWLTAGTMCSGEITGKFAKKYRSCTECDIFQKATGKDVLTELQELIIVLIHSLRCEHQELKKNLEKVKLLSGFLPICSSCKKIRDDKGYWQQVEEYIRNHSEAEFTHSLCSDCAENIYPDFYNKIIGKKKFNSSDDETSS